MTRARYADVVIDPSGRPVAGTAVDVFDQGTTTPVAGPIYAAASGVATLVNPITVGTDGEFEFYLGAPARVDLRYSKTGYTSESHTVDVLDANHEHIGTTVALTGAQSIAGLKTFRDGFTSRTVAGDTGSGSITMKTAGDLASGVIDWTHNGDFGYLVHLTTGPNLVTPYACIGVGIDYGGNGILLSNKATGRGLFLDQQDTISSATAYGMYLRQKSMAPLLFLEQAKAGSATCLEIAGNLTQAGDKLIRVSHATLGEYGTVDAHTGELTWLRVVTLSTASAGTAAIQVASNRTISFRNNAGSAYRKALTQDATDKIILGDQDSSGAVAIRAGSTTAITLESNGSVRLTVDSQGLTVQDGKAIFSTSTGGLKIGNLSTHYIGFWGATPIQKPAAVTGSRGGNAALADLLTKLASTDLITDSTSA